MYVTADGNNLNNVDAYADSTKQLMQDLKNNFKNIQFKNMFFKHLIKFCDPVGLKELQENANWWLQKREAKSEEECKELFRNWIKNQIQKFSAHAIVMMDEMCVLAFCNREKFLKDPSNIVLDLSFLAEYENIRFVICLSPVYINYRATKIPTSFDLDFYKGSEKVTYHYLSGRYRNTAGILQFINFVADNYQHCGYEYCELHKESDESIKPENLPLPFDFPNEPKWKNCKPVIWFQNLSNAKSVIYDLLKGKPVTFLSVLSYQNQSSKLKKVFGLAEQKNSEWEYHPCVNFNGSEADVIVYVAPYGYNRQIYWPAMSRARRLLVIIANNSNIWKENLEVFENGINKGFVTKGEELLDTY